MSQATGVLEVHKHNVPEAKYSRCTALEGTQPGQSQEEHSISLHFTSHIESHACSFPHGGLNDMDEGSGGQAAHEGVVAAVHLEDSKASRMIDGHVSNGRVVAGFHLKPVGALVATGLSQT